MRVLKKKNEFALKVKCDSIMVSYDYRPLSLWVLFSCSAPQSAETSPP